MVAILQSTWASGSPEARSRDRVLERLRLSQERYGGQNNLFRTLSRYYFSLSPHIRPRDNDRPTSGRREDYPDLFPQRSFTSVEAAVPPWVFSVVGGHPPVKVYARKEEEKRKAEAVERMIAYDWERSEVLHRSIEVAKQLFKYGTGIAKVGYKYDAYKLKRSYDVTEPAGFNERGELLTKTRTHKSEEEVTRFDGPWLDPVSVFNAHPDPYYHRIRDMRYFAIRRWADRQTLKLENENHERLTGKPKYKNLDKIPHVRTGYLESVYQMDYGDDMAEAMGWSNAFNLHINRYVHGPAAARRQMEDNLVELVEYWDRDDKLVILANEETPVLDGPNPFDDKELPFVATRCYVVDGQFWGWGYLHAIRRSQEEFNANRNLAYREAQLRALSVWGYDEATGIDPDIDLSPGTLNKIPMDANGNPGIVRLYEAGPLPPDPFIIEDRIDRDMQLANAQPMWNSGPQGADSATEANIANQNVQARLRLQALQGELTYATEIARLFHSRRQQFLRDDGEEFRILGADGVNYEKMTKQDIAGEYDFMTAGQFLHASQDVVRQQLEQVITIVGGNPIFMQMTNIYEVWREMWRMFGFDRVERFLNPPPDKTVPPDIENRVLAHGEWIQTNMMDNHEEHMMAHQQAIGQARDEKAMEMFMLHIAEHEKHVKQSQQMAPPQEQPGLRGYEGNVPNLENAVESQGSLAARVGGAGNSR